MYEGGRGEKGKADVSGTLYMGGVSAKVSREGGGVPVRIIATRALRGLTAVRALEDLAGSKRRMHSVIQSHQWLGMCAKSRRESLV